MGVSKNRGKTPKMDGENNGKPYEQMDDLGVPLFLETPISFERVLMCTLYSQCSCSWSSFSGNAGVDMLTNKSLQQDLSIVTWQHIFFMLSVCTFKHQ